MPHSIGLIVIRGACIGSLSVHFGSSTTSQPLHFPPFITHHTAQESACTSSQPHASINPALLDLPRGPTQRSPIIQATCSICQSDSARLSAFPYIASRCASSIWIPWSSANLSTPSDRPMSSSLTPGVPKKYLCRNFSFTSPMPRISRPKKATSRF